MPGSYDYFKSDVKVHLLNNVNVNSKILDVGPGYGTYGNLLKPEYTNVDAVEIWQPYVEQFNLRSIYQNIYISDILNFDYSTYNYLILGDVLEHISLSDAQLLISNITSSNKQCLVAVPYMYPQGEHDGNIFETHLQPDLTPVNVLQRYPQLSCLFNNDVYGYYINY